MITERGAAPEVFALLDASVVAPYYVPESGSGAKSKRVNPRITGLMEAVRNGGAPYILLYIPSFCVAEVFGVFDKYRFGSWIPQLKKVVPDGIPQCRYEGARRRFSEDVAHGKLLHAYNLSGCHVRATDLISPVDHYYQHYRERGRRRVRLSPMGTSDRLIIAMGICLSRIHGRRNLAVVTADDRLAVILERARRMKRNTAERLGIPQAAERLALDYSADLYPRVVNLAKCTNGDLSRVFRLWPLPARGMARRPVSELDEFKPTVRSLYKEVNVPLDRLAYTAEFERLHARVVHERGAYITRSQLWRLLLKMRKAAGGGGLPRVGRRAPR
ncbi:hypothetical protein HQ563_00935 [bacterium]|nr:hypothetical protein [bacterium]